MANYGQKGHIFSFQSVAGVFVEGGVMKMQICAGGKKGGGGLRMRKPRLE